MKFVLMVAILMAFCLVMVLGMLSVLQQLMQKNHDEPVFGDEIESSDLDETQDDSKSRFVWQSRLRSQVRD